MSSTEVIHALNHSTVIQEYYAPTKQNWRAGEESEASTDQNGRSECVSMKKQWISKNNMALWYIIKLKQTKGSKE